MSDSHKRVTFPGGYSPWETRGDCHFNRHIAANSLRFFRKRLRHVKGERCGQPLRLRKWQRDIVTALFGYRRPDETRRYRTAYIEIPRKAGKSTLASGIALLMLYCDNEPGAEIYSCASDRDQAAIVFEIAKENVQRCAMLDARSKVYQRSIVHYDPKTGVAKGSYKVLSAEAASKHGYNPSTIIFDELHAQPNRDLWDVMKTGTGARSQPLTIAITTAGFDRHSICWEVRQQAVAVREGEKENEAFLPVIYAAEFEDDWKSEDTWRKAQPNLDISVPLSFYRDEFKNASSSAGFENTFRRLYLNQWTEQDVRAIPMDRWDACGEGADPVKWRAEVLESFKGESCVAALDLGGLGDLTALVLLFGESEPFTFLPFFWVPKDSADTRSRRDHVPYNDWLRTGFAKPTPESAMDYDQVRADINEIGNDYGIRTLAIDRLFQGDQLSMQLMQDGFEVAAFGQGFMSMAAPTKRLLELIAGEGIRHGNNPVLRWMARNAATEMDSAGNLKFSKKKSFERIDGIIGMVMALSRVASEDHIWQPEDGVCL